MCVKTRLYRKSSCNEENKEDDTICLVMTLLCLQFAQEKDYKNDKNSFVTTWMKLEIIILSKRIQTQEDKYFMISFICVI